MLNLAESTEEILARCYSDTRVTARVLFDEDFSSPFSVLHDQIFKAIDSGHQKVVIAAPRGLGKTTIAKLVAAKGIIYRDVSFVTYISRSATLAELQTENIKRSLLSNQLITQLFGNIKISDNPQLDDSFSRLAWVAFGNTLVLPRGAGQQVRGLNWNGHRPQLIVIDDLEDSEEVRNPDNRKKLKEWFFADLMRCVNKYTNDWRIIYIDTLKHEDSLLANLLESKDWYPLQQSICDENFHSYAPFYMSDEEIQIELESHREHGILDIFYRELMNIPIALEDAVFKQEYFKYYDEMGDEFLDEVKDLDTFVIVDPAKTAKLQSADSAILGVGVNRKKGSIYFRDLLAKKFYPDEVIDESLAMCTRLGSRILGVEVTGLNDWILYPFKNAVAEKHLNIEIVELKAGTQKKEERDAAALAPLYRRGQIYHNKSVTAKLEAQLLSFPRCKRFDCIDAAAYTPIMLEQGERYFFGSDDDEEPMDSMIFPKDVEPAFTGFRVI